MVAPRFAWRVAPPVMIGKLDAGDARIVSGLAALGDLFAARMEAWMQANAPWSDDTGEARASLVAYADASAAGMVITVAGLARHNIFLEMGTYRMAPRPILQPAIDAHLAAIASALEALISGAF